MTDFKNGRLLFPAHNDDRPPESWVLTYWLLFPAHHAHHHDGWCLDWLIIAPCPSWRPTSWFADYRFPVHHDNWFLNWLLIASCFSFQIPDWLIMMTDFIERQLLLPAHHDDRLSDRLVGRPVLLLSQPADRQLYMVPRKKWRYYRKFSYRNITISIAFPFIYIIL